MTSIANNESLATVRVKLNNTLAVVHNVRDFGATGNGTTDDWDAIQRTVNWNTGTDRGIIFFPPGIYKVGQPIVFNGKNATTGSGSDDLAQGIGDFSIIFQGCGKASTIRGDFNNDYILKRSWNAPTSGFRGVRDLELQPGGSNTCGVLLMGTVSGEVSGLRSTCYRCVNTGGDCYSVVISHCKFNSGLAADSFGMSVGNGCIAVGCDIQGYENAVRMSKNGCTVIGGRIEVADVGIKVGIDHDGQTNQAGGFVIAGVSFESCNDAGIEISAGGGLITGCAITANLSPPNECQRGLYMHGADSVAVSGSTVSGQFAITAVDAGSNARVSFTSCNVNNTGTGPDWANVGAGPWYRIPYFKSTYSVPTFTTTFADLGSASGVPETEGPYLITNCNTTTFRAVAAGGGANRVLVRSNGTNWIVVG